MHAPPRLLTAGSRVTNTGMKWNDAHTRVANQGESPSLIEPVAGTVRRRGLRGEWALPIGSPVTTWYVISVRR